MISFLAHTPTVTIFTCPATDLRLVYAARQQLNQADEWGNTVLIAAAFLRPPVAVVQRLLQAAAVAWPTSMDLCSARARDGSTALQVACATGASPPVIAALCGCSSLPIAPPCWKKRISTSGGSSGSNTSTTISLLQHVDLQGGTPLTEMVMQYTLERKVSQRTAAAPLLEHLEWCPSSSSSSLSSTTTTTTIMDMTCLLPRNFCDKLETILQAAWKQHHDDDSSPNDNHGPLLLLHLAAHVCYACPPLLWDVLQHKWQKHGPEAVLQTDAHGRLPLHIALTALSNDNHFASLTATARQALRERQVHAVHALITTATANTPCPQTGRLPVTIAIAAGLTCGPVEHLWTTARETVDPVTGLPLFALAALANDDDDDDLTLIYELLRRQPAALTV